MPKKDRWQYLSQKDENRSQGLWITYPTYPTPRDFLSFRKRYNISASALGAILGTHVRGKPYGRSYIKHLEGGSQQIRPHLAKAFDEIAAQFEKKKNAKPRAEKIITLVSKFKLPKVEEVHVNLRPRQCRGHRRITIMAPTQIYCGTSIKQRAECQKLWRRKNVQSHHTLQQRHISRKRKPNKVFHPNRKRSRHDSNSHQFLSHATRSKRNDKKS